MITRLNSDSAYSVKQYDMHDTIMVSGTYKDEGLTIPNGKFVYHLKMRISKDVQDVEFLRGIDTNNFIKNVGYFLNGKRTGMWVTYSARGKVSQKCSFVDDIANGPYEQFYDEPFGYRGVGTMVNGVLEGKYYVYTDDSLLVAESDYHNNKEINAKVHLQAAIPSQKFDNYLEKNLKKYKKQLTETRPVVKFTVSKTGEVKDFEIVKGLNPEIDGVLIAAMVKAPACTPATYDKSPIEQKVTLQLVLFQDYRSPDAPLPEQMHYKERLSGLIPPPSGPKPGVTYLQ